MILGGMLLLLIGICLSAFFSGSETGFYRASRLRIVMDAMEGDKVSRRLLFLTNRPLLFVATSLVGNNTANYLTSMAIVLLTKSIFGTGVMMELLASLFFSPIVFVYGELMPKNLFYQAPNFLLRLSSRMVLFFAVVFAPISGFLWMLGRLLEKLFGQSPEKVRLTLARKDLGNFFVEGQHAGILHSTQLQLAQNFFLVASLPVTQWMEPASRLITIDRSATREEAIKKMRKYRITEMVVRIEDEDTLAGYIRFSDLTVNDSSVSLVPYLNSLTDMNSSMLHGEAIMQLQATGQLIAQVVDDDGTMMGVVTLDSLTNPLLIGSLAPLVGQPVTAGFPIDIQAT